MRLLASARIVLTALLIAFGRQAAEAEDFVTFVDDPAILAALEGKGYGFAGLFGIEGEGGLATLNAKSPAYKKIVDIVGADVASLRADMKAGGRPLYEVTDGNVGRVIDMRWLTTEAARFRLVGVINRLDRRILPRSMASRDAARSASSIGWPMLSRRRAGCSPRACRSISTPSIPSCPTPTAVAPASPAAGGRSSMTRSTPAGWPAGRSIPPTSPSSSSSSTHRWSVFPRGRRPSSADRPRI